MKHFYVPFVDTIFTKKGTWFSTLHEGKKPFNCSICDYKCSQKRNLTRHIASVHEGKKPNNCSICDYKCLKRGIWLSTFQLFMRERSHSIVPFVITTVHKRGTWLCTLHQFIRAKNHMSVQFVITNVQQSRAWLSTLLQCMRARNH